MVQQPSGIQVQRRGSTIEKAHALLSAGPASTEMLAERALGLRGHPGAAAAAVFAMLGGDDRFTVDAGGVWSLAEPLELVAPSLLQEEWVVVDVETTGGSPQRGDRVTEIAAVRVADGEIQDVYSTLVNPGRPIPSMIMSLTGITNEMVADAPRFHEIAPELCEFLAGSVFVAHNAAFDWRFVCAELEAARNNTLAGRKLCTVRLARKLLPHLPSRSLDGLAVYFGLDIDNRHRAEDDAVATATILLRFIEMLEEQGVTDWAGVQSVLNRRKPRKKRSLAPRSMEQG